MTAAAAHTTATARPLLGILFMMAAGTVFPVMNGLVQVLAPYYPSEQIVWARTASHLAFVLALFSPRHGFVRLIHTSRLGTQVVRSVLLMLSTLCFFTALRHLPLASAASISFTAPFVVALAAWPILGERVSAGRLIAVAAGFVGVLIVIRPGTAVFHPASLLAVGSALCYGLYQVFTRRVAAFDAPETSAVYSALVGTLIMSVAAMLVWTPIQSATHAALLLSLGVIGGTGHYCVARALTYAQASVLAPFQYWQMVGSVIVGYLITGLFPDAWTWLGAAIIIGAGLALGWAETRERSKA